MSERPTEYEIEERRHTETLRASALNAAVSLQPGSMETIMSTADQFLHWIEYGSQA